MEHYLIIVSRDRPDLLGTLAIAYGQRGKARIRFDRRKGQPWTGTGDRPDRRARSSRDRDLQKHGFLVIPRPTPSAWRAESVVSAGAHERRASPLVVFFD